MGPFAWSPPRGAPPPPPCALREESPGRAGASGAAVTAARLKAIGDELQGRTEEEEEARRRGQGRERDQDLGGRGVSAVPGAPAVAWLSLAALAALAWLSRRGSR